MVVSIQWDVSIRRLDAATVVISLSGYHSIPRTGHMERAKWVVVYLAKMKHTVIRFRPGLPDYSDIPYMRYDWERLVYVNIKEDLPKDAPKVLGKPIILTHYVDANLYHDFLKGHSVIGMLYFINQTPIVWCSKKKQQLKQLHARQNS